ncbi:HEPN domain-containing protein [Nonomuraea maritima]|uniref:HEPN domain-containing protein n=1 Tax=Nonomuraea maritima TaxID=683260 RepID=UPI00115FBD5B|nr:HEPN domain-containing protein [Nonomuraea maritima]
MKSLTPVQRMYHDNKYILEHLRNERQFSFHASLQTTLPKVLLLAAASEFEEGVSETIRDYIREHATDDNKILELVNQKAIHRNYHSLFDWNARNATNFWALFGSGFKSGMRKYCQGRADLTRSISAFMEIGSLRNYLVHNNYAIAVLDKTVDEVYDVYEQGRPFVEELPQLLRMSF